MKRIVLLCVGVAAGCSNASAKQDKVPTAVRVHAVEKANGGKAARYSATINPATRVDVAFKVGGYVQGIATVKGVDGKMRILQEGDKVVRGQELAFLRKADYSQKLGEANAALAEARASRQQAQNDFDRATKLSETNSISKAELDNARIKLDATTARADGARVRVEEAQTAVGDSTVRAPLDGVILKRGIEVGTLAGAGTLAFSIADTSTVKAAFGVPDTVLQTLRLGARQSIQAEAYRGRSFDGQITRIAPAADAKSRVFEVEISIVNPFNELRAGMIASLKLAEGSDTPVAVLPLSAIVRSPEHKNAFAVYLLDDQSIAHVREVQLGEFLGNVIPIRAGLHEGERVVVQGATLIADGEHVQVIP